MQICDVGVSGLSVAAIEGRLDTATAPGIESLLLHHLSQSHVVLDMAKVVFVSSAGLRVLLKAAKAAKTSGNAFSVCGLQPAVREVYDISGFDRIIVVHATRDHAVAEMSRDLPREARRAAG